ncbi:MAG: DNA gyrase subunit B, partial [Hyphomonas sp.]|nr:DNA gyrase subunit B [Hyphomonas sp.]
LLLTFFYRQMPELIERGYLYIAQPPLYKVTRGRSERYLKDDSELDAYLIDEGTDGEKLILADGSTIAGEDLRDRVRQAATFRANLKRLALRASGDLIEQAALSGALAAGAGEAEAQLTAERMNRFAEEGEDNWAGRFVEGALVLQRSVRSVDETVALPPALLASQDAVRLAERAAGLADMYDQPAILRHEKGGEITVHGPSSLLTAVLESGRKGLKIQRYKGLGEMNADQLWETTLDANARTLLQVKVDHADEADDMFTKLMGDVVEPRREFIEENALDAEVDV